MGGAILNWHNFSTHPMLLSHLVQLVGFWIVLMGKDRQESIMVGRTSYAFK
jgi:hypothetical protein